MLETTKMVEIHLFSKLCAIYGLCHCLALLDYMTYVLIEKRFYLLQDYAENTMNELLGWYGYDKVNSADTEHLNLERYTGIDDVRSPTDGGSRDDDSICSDDDSLSGRSDFSRLSKCMNP